MTSGTALRAQLFHDTCECVHCKQGVSLREDGIAVLVVSLEG